MVKENVSERCFAFWCVEGCQVNACIGEGLICWGEDCERALTLEGCQQFCLNHSGHKRIVNAGALSGAWDVVWCERGCQHLVDHVNQTVASCYVGCGNSGSVDHDAVTDGEGKWVSVDRGC